MAFGEGFYGFLGEQLKSGNRNAPLLEAYDAASRLFSSRGFRKGNPNPRRVDGRIVSDYDGEYFKLDPVAPRDDLLDSTELSRAGSFRRGGQRRNSSGHTRLRHMLQRVNSELLGRNR